MQRLEESQVRTENGGKSSNNITSSVDSLDG